jgi:hypothetical protein
VRSHLFLNEKLLTPSFAEMCESFILSIPFFGVTLTLVAFSFFSFCWSLYVSYNGVETRFTDLVFFKICVTSLITGESRVIDF